MRQIRIALLKPALAGVLALALGSAGAATSEWNPVRSHPVDIGPQANRLVVGFRATSGNTVTRAIRRSSKAQIVNVTQAQTSDAKKPEPKPPHKRKIAKRRAVPPQRKARRTG